MKQTVQCTVVPYGGPEWKSMVALRDRVLRKPLGLSFTEEQLAAEGTDTHILARNTEGTLVGCLVLTAKSPTEIKMRQVAVAPEVQRSGVGKAMVEFCEAHARANGFTKMVLSARETAVPFYLQLGYHVEGDPYEEVTIPHRFMCKTL